MRPVIAQRNSAKSNIMSTADFVVRFSSFTTFVAMAAGAGAGQNIVRPLLASTENIYIA